MMKRERVQKTESCCPSVKPAKVQSIFAPRPFAPPIEEHEVPAAGPVTGFNFADINIFPRETVQPKLVLGPVGDKYEQEADRVARRVVQTISSSEQESVQREVDLEDEEELDLEEEELRRKVDVSSSAGGADVGPGLESAIHRARGQGQPLSDRVRQPMERAFGADFGGVRVHTDGKADSLNRSLQARAFTTGRDIFLKRGEFRPGSSEGQRLLAHELTHVVQQNGGAVQRAQMQATGRFLQAKGEAPKNRTGMPDHLKSGLEKPSGMMGANALQMKIGDENNVVFGLNGKDKSAIESAVNAGYSVFDGADSYGQTINILADVMKDQNKTRSDYEVVYKVSITKPHLLEGHLRTIAEKFGDYLDHVLIHKAPDLYASQHWIIINYLKDRDVIKNVGMGDARVDVDADFKNKDCFEIDANAILVAPGAEDLAKKLKEAKKPVFVYNVMSTLTKVLEIEGREVTSTQLSAFLSMIKGVVPKAEPILSSGSQERIKSNLKAYDYEEKDMMTVFNDRKTIENAIKNLTIGTPVNKMEDEVKGKMKTLINLHAWDEDVIWKSKEECNKELNQKVKLFNDQQLQTKYEGLGESKGNAFTLMKLMKMLYNYGANCDRVKAYNFLIGMYI